MMQTQQRQLLRLSSAIFLFPSLPPPPSSHHLYFFGRPTNPNHYSLCSAHKAWLAQLSDELAAAAQPPAEGPTELPFTISSLNSASDDLSALQTAASFLITGAFSLFLFRTLRRAAKRAKERKLRSAALESLRKASRSEVDVKGKKKKKKNPPTVDETLVGALIAAAFGLLLYKFTTSVENTLNNQPLSSNYSVRQITITIRTIINGLCYLATFVFGFNSLGLLLYSGQLAMNLFVDVRVSEDKVRSNSSYSENMDGTEDQSSDNTVQK